MLRDFYRSKALEKLKNVKTRETEAYADELFACFLRESARPLVLLGLLSLGSPSKIIKTLGLPKSIVYHHVRNLVRRGVIRKEKIGSLTIYKPSNLCLNAIVLFNEKLLDVISQFDRVDERVDDLTLLLIENPGKYFERLLYCRSLINNAEVSMLMNETGQHETV